MADIVLVHGAWLGGWSWERVVPLLEAAGHRVFARTLAGVAERAGEATTADLSAHIGDVTDLAAAEPLRGFVLVGHSYGGMVIAGVASAMPERIGRMIFFDAIVPEDGQSFFDRNSENYRRRTEAEAAASAGVTVPPPDPELIGVTDPRDLAWMRDRLTPHPIATMRETVRVSAASRALPAIYVYCTRSDFAETAARCRGYGWPVVEMDTGHLPMVTDPRETAEVLLRLAGLAG